MENPQHVLIEQYLDGTLSSEARASFEDQLAGDPALARELRLHEIARAAVEIQALFDRHQTLYRRGQQKLNWRKWWWKLLDTLESILFKQPPDGGRHLRWGLIAAVGLAGIAAIVLFINRDDPASPAPSPKPLAVPKEKAVIAFNTYYKHLDLSGTLGADDYDSLYLEARARYSANNCAAALQSLAPLVADPEFKYRPNALLLQGTCLLEQGNAAAAIEALRQVPTGAARLHQEAQWYIALAYLKQENTETASTILRDIAADPRNKHQKEARQILGIE